MPELALYDLARYFETIVLSSQVGVKKPNSLIFARGLSNLKVKPGEAVFVGNDLMADIMGASALGMKTIYILQKSNRPVDHVKDFTPDAVISNVNLSEVLAIVDTWNSSTSE